MFTSKNRQWNGLCSLATVMLAPWCIAVADADSLSPSDADPDGARIFVERCVLCHGNYGAGDGFIPMVIPDYPDTNLLNANQDGHFNDAQKHVKWGGVNDSGNNDVINDANDKSPPWQDELSTAELKAVADFVMSLQKSPEQHWQILNAHLDNKPVDLETGRLVYQTRCVSCHGASGQGDGPMSAIVKTPPPYNLKLSQLSKQELSAIISLGGLTVGRSQQMPSWKHELTQVEIDSVVAYIHQLRK